MTPARYEEIANLIKDLIASIGFFYLDDGTEVVANLVKNNLVMTAVGQKWQVHFSPWHGHPGLLPSNDKEDKQEEKSPMWIDWRIKDNLQKKNMHNYPRCIVCAALLTYSKLKKEWASKTGKPLFCSFTCAAHYAVEAYDLIDVPDTAEIIDTTKAQDTIDRR